MFTISTPDDPLFFGELNDLGTIAVVDYVIESHWAKLYSSNQSVDERPFFGDFCLQQTGTQRILYGIEYVHKSPGWLHNIGSSS